MSDWAFATPRFDFKQRLEDRLSAWAGHEDLLYDLVVAMRPGVAVDICGHPGYPFLTMCQAVQDAGLPTALFVASPGLPSGERLVHYSHARDPEPGPAERSSSPLDADDPIEALGNLAAGLYPAVSIDLSTGPPCDASGEHTDGSVDLLHFDGLLDAAVLEPAFDAWADKLAPGATVIVHGIRDTTGGAGAIWQRLSRAGEVLELDWALGLGVFFGPEGTLAGLGTDIGALRDHYALAHAREVVADRDAYCAALCALGIERSARESLEERFLEAVTARDQQTVAVESERAARIEAQQTLEAERAAWNAERARRGRQP